ncbi:hypothetical protein [Nonomuraea jabiensis]|uniref:hypothetical protein n=1 Tax=Nonomuraea jabiensis TaxID=882448 RepID=UPI003D70D6F2
MRKEVASFGIDVICLEPGPYATGFGAGSIRTSAENPDYAKVRAATAIEWDLGDPKAIRRPILELTRRRGSSPASRWSRSRPSTRNSSPPGASGSRSRRPPAPGSRRGRGSTNSQDQTRLADTAAL